jgi:hypothetical protein
LLLFFGGLDCDDENDVEEEEVDKVFEEVENWWWGQNKLL